MKDFTMSMYKSKEDLYKAKAEYYEGIANTATSLLEEVASNSTVMMYLSHVFEDKLDKFLESLNE